MADTISPEQRSAVMRQVKSKNTKPEMRIRSLLHKRGFRFRLHRRDLPGVPDLVFPSRKAVIFIHGCFWHGHPCKRGQRPPATNAEYWRAKIARNEARDTVNLQKLADMGWKVIVVWECEMKQIDAVIDRLAAELG
jgi:DNA mismatch endonuclease (patch repair protein)